MTSCLQPGEPTNTSRSTVRPSALLVVAFRPSSVSMPREVLDVDHM